MKILNVFFSIVTALCFSSVSNAETTQTTIKPELSSTMLDAGLGLAMFRGSTGWAVNVGLLREWNPESTLYYGADISMNLWNFSSAAGTTSSSATGVQLLPTVVYYFTVEGQKNFRPYVGASFGPHLYFSRTTTPITGTITDNRVLLELLFRPGIALSIGKEVALQMEAKLGLLDADFVFLPQVNAAFPL